MVAIFDPDSKAGIKNLDVFGIWTSEIDTSTRRIQSASPEKSALIQIHTDSSMKLRIRLLETPPKVQQKLLPEVYIFAYGCGNWGMSVKQNETLTRQNNDENLIGLWKMFVHHSRIFYVSTLFQQNDHYLYEIRSNDGKFFTSLPTYFSEEKDLAWDSGDYISYDDILLFVPLYTVPHNLNVMLITEDYFREYQIIHGNEHLSNYSSRGYGQEVRYRMRSVLMFQHELLAVTKWGTQFYDDQAWIDFDMDWTGLEGTLHETIQLFVVHTKNGDHLFAFANPAGM